MMQPENTSHNGDFPLQEWRLIHTPPAAGAWNMAVDEALLESMRLENALPVLRLYAWDPACLSLGYAQPASDVDLEALLQRGWDLVRRPTGGRAILHTDELTYAVIGPHSDPRLAGSVLESYQRLSRALLDALHRLQVPAHSQAQALIPPGSDPKGAVCFEVPSNYEITVDGKKLIGSAQARKRDGVLQHGSLPLSGDLKRITQALAYPDEANRQTAAQRLAERATTVAESLGIEVSWKTAAQAYAQAFRDRLNIRFIESDLTNQERLRAQALLGEKYANHTWTFRV
jgi:lipoate-protein ligase A